MLRTFIDNTDLIQEAPELQDYYRTGQSNWDTTIELARDRLEREIINRGKKLRLLTSKLSLTDDTKSSEDEIYQRTRLVIVTTAVTPTPTATFKGTNDESSETWTDIPLYVNNALSSISIGTTGTTTYTFRDVYKYYKLTWTGTITSTQYLVERSFELPHLFLSAHMAYKDLQRDVGGNFDDKAKYYWDMYVESLDNALYSYDVDDDGTAEADELEINRVMLRR